MHTISFHLLPGLEDVKITSFLKLHVYRTVLITQIVIHYQLAYLKILFSTSFFNILSDKCYDVSIDRYSSILHSRLHLNHSALNYYLRKINRNSYPEFACGENYESEFHYLLKCPRYSTLTLSLLSTVAEVYCDSRYLSSDTQKLNLFVFGLPNLNIFN